MFRRKLAIGIFLFLGLLVNAVALGADLDYQVDRSEDDSFGTEVGGSFVTAPYVAIKDPNYQTFSHFLFRNILIYNSRIINNATLSVYTTSNQAADLSALATIYGLEVDDGDLVNSSSITDALVVWNISQVRGIGTWHNVTVTNIVQELIDRYNWDYGDNLAFEILAVSGVHRLAVAYDYGNPTLAARLYLSYGEAPPDPPGLPPGAEYNQTVEGYDVYRIPGYGQVTSVVTDQQWDKGGQVYPFQEKTAYSNVTDRFYLFGFSTSPHGRNITYLSKPRVSDTWETERTTLITAITDASGLYFDTHLWSDGQTLDVAWIDPYPVTNPVWYQRFTLQADGTAQNVTDRTKIWEDGATLAKPPITIMLDSEGYPYVAFATLQGAIHSGQVAWSNLNNGTFNNTANSPVSVEAASGGNPPNVNGPYVCELYRGGDRRMFLIYLAPDSPGDINEVRSARTRNSGAWIAEGDPTGDASSNRLRRFSVSGSSICDDADSFNSSLVTPDGGQHELYHRPVNVLVNLNQTWDSTDILVMGATTNGIYFTLGAENNTKTSRVRIREGTWTEWVTARTFTDAVGDILTWKFTGQQYPVRNNSKTIVSYAWRDDGMIGFWHDWFYIESGPDNTTTDPSYQAWDNGTLAYTCPTLDCLIDIIEAVDPNPQDPEPSPWVGTPALLGRFAMRRYFLMIGWGMFWGPIWFFCYRRPSGYLIGAAFIFMLIGLGLLLQIPYV